jgi:UDP-N-acetylmuramyl pentapeptide phosphotransferase/UDP-N-acetylglucosamine-1-phosphate transferase
MSDFWNALGSLSPLWALLLLLSVCTFAGHWFTKRTDDDDARMDLSDSASKLLGATATGLFVLIGFTISMLWWVLTDELDAVNQEVQTSGSIAGYAFLLEDDAKDRIDADLANYIQIVTTQDLAALQQGETGVLPSTSALVQLLAEVNSSENYTSENQWIKSELVEQVTALGSERASIRSIANRSMPSVLQAVLLIAAVVVAVFAGASMAAHRRPYLVIGWVLSSALALSLAFWLNNPVTGPISADFRSLEKVAENINQPVE